MYWVIIFIVSFLARVHLGGSTVGKKLVLQESTLICCSILADIVNVTNMCINKITN